MSSTAGNSSTTGSRSTGDTTIRVIVFSEDWESWKEKFIVKSGFRGYENILTGEDQAPKTHNMDGTKSTLTADETALSVLNKTGYGDLILSINCSTAAGKVAFASIKGAKTKEIPGGDLRAAFLRLKKKYEPSTTLQLMQLTRVFHSKTLQSTQDLDILITDLEALKVQMEELDHKISDKSLILHILNNLSPEYEMEIKMLEHQMQRLKEEGKELSIDEVRNKLNVKFERLKRTLKTTDHAFYMGATFKGKCNWCGKIGHKSTECKTRITGKPQSNSHSNQWNNNNNNNNVRNNNNNNNYNKNNFNSNNKRQSLFCTYCNIKGHDVSECRKKKREEGD
jgi:hypothetical protein